MARWVARNMLSSSISRLFAEAMLQMHSGVAFMIDDSRSRFFAESAFESFIMDHDPMIAFSATSSGR